jgi:phosphoglycolate phosphatase
VDIETARRAGIECLSVLWGFRSREQLASAGATHFFESPEELSRFLTENP